MRCALSDTRLQEFMTLLGSGCSEVCSVRHKPSKSSVYEPFGFRLSTRTPQKDQMGPKWAQDEAKRGQDGAKCSQDGPAWCQDGAKTGPREAKRAKMGPRWGQDEAKRGQDGAKMSPREARTEPK